jgi:hypothetical protein
MGYSGTVLILMSPHGGLENNAYNNNNIYNEALKGSHVFNRED